MENQTEGHKDSDRPLVTHLVELRARLLKIVFTVGIVFLLLFPFANPVYEYLSQPLLEHLPQGSSMVAIDVASPFLTPFKLVILLAVVLAVPIIFYHMWGFISPGLYRKERRLVFPFLILSTMLFYLGMAFAYYVAFPLMFSFFNSVTPNNVTVMTDIGRYLDFVVKIFFAFGIAFEVPIITVLLVLSGTVTPEALQRKRPYIIVGAFIFGMILTPPDVISQVLLAVPMWLLFELGVLIARGMVKAQAKRSDPSG